VGEGGEGDNRGSMLAPGDARFPLRSGASIAPAMPVRDPVRRFSAGDALRGFSALGVLGLHVAEFALGASVAIPEGQVFAALRSAYGVAGLLALAGGLSLSIFFVLSGYLISRPFVTAYIQGGEWPPLRAYARNRILRIVPAFWVAVIATLVVFGLSGSSPLVVVVTLAFGQVFIPTEPFVTHIAQGWTLGAELAFYALVPVVALALGRRRSGTPRARARRLLALCAATLLASLLWRSLDPRDGVWVQVFPAVAAAFAPGVALAVAGAAWPRAFARPRPRRLALPIALSGVACLFLAASAPSQYTWWRWLAEIAGGALIVAGAWLREASGGEAWWLLRNRVSHWLGERSYSIYVLHFGVALWLVERIAVDGHPRETLLRLAPLTLLVTLVLADLSWRFVERPFLRRKRRPSLPVA
jgi:peptidoglycan/LPS O-acetylase OafA/YrhL